jgi:hypothetical protein
MTTGRRSANRQSKESEPVIAAEPVGREHEVRANEVFSAATDREPGEAGTGRQPIAAPASPKPGDDDASITVADVAQQNRDGVLAVARVTTVTRASARRRRGLDQDLIRAIRKNPGLNATELRQLVRGTRANVLAELGELADDGVVIKVRDGHKVTYELAEQLAGVG